MTVDQVFSSSSGDGSGETSDSGGTGGSGGGSGGGDSETPSAPGTPFATAGDGSVTLSWDAPFQ